MRTYAPRGQTPLLAVPLTRDHLEVIAGLTRSGRLLIHIQDHSYKGPDVVRFLRHLLGQITGRLLVIWDGGAIHWEGAVPAFLAARGAARLELVQLPGYAPELNPVEGIWQHLKTVELGNGCCRDQGVLRNQLRLAIARLWQKPEVIQGCIRHAGY